MGENEANEIKKKAQDARIGAHLILHKMAVKSIEAGKAKNQKAQHDLPPKKKHTEKPATAGGSVLFDVKADHLAGTAPQAVLRKSGAMARMALELVRAYPRYVAIADLAKRYPDCSVDNRISKFPQWRKTFQAEFSENGHQVRVKLLNPKALVGASLRPSKSAEKAS